MERTITVTAEWRSYHTIEVPDDAPGAGLSDEALVAAMPMWLAEQIDTSTAELINWSC